MNRRELLASLGAIGAAPLACAAHGNDKPGASPMTGPHAHFCGIHMAKNNPKLQFITQHYCTGHAQSGQDDMFQCVLFDGTGANAKLIGVEYLVSDAAYRKLPDAEKKYWHAHTFEVLGGGLVAPGMPEADEKKFMGMVINMWGKAWHTWPDPSTPVPMGEPLLIWSLGGDGQVDEKLLAKRDKDFNVNVNELRAKRAKEFGLEVPQVPPPKAMDELGRQWTASGDDAPKKK
jgi:hypothetical protein